MKTKNIKLGTPQNDEIHDKVGTTNKMWQDKTTATGDMKMTIIM